MKVTFKFEVGTRVGYVGTAVVGYAVEGFASGNAIDRDGIKWCSVDFVDRNGELRSQYLRETDLVVAGNWKGKKTKYGCAGIRI